MLTTASARTLSLFCHRAVPSTAHAFLPSSRLPLCPFSSTRCLPSSASPYPLYYELISYRPSRRPRRPRRGDGTVAASLESQPAEGSGAGIGGAAEAEEPATEAMLDRSKRKYYRKREKRLYGESDADRDDGTRGQSEFVELEPEVVDFPRLHAREEELYFYDAFAFPWEKDKHYRMVYQLEKKFFPDQCLDNAFIKPGQEPPPEMERAREKRRGGKRSASDRNAEQKDDTGLIFFEEQGGLQAEKKKTAAGHISEKKVEEFFKCLKKVPSAASDDGRSVVATGEPFLVSRKSGLPPKWDGPSGTVVLVDKPKGWTSFTVCGKLRRLIEVQKVGHAGTLDPMATGLLIVCVGKATKLVERYQDMFKGYSGVFRLGEATSTWDADSPVIQREPWEHIKDEDIRKAAASFCGETWQVPPMFSAIKVGGEKMYDKARRGETVELSPRRISIFKFDIERSLEDRQNLIFRVTCSKGTYIRSLCADFGKSLGSCAHLTALRRDLIGEYSVDDAWDFQELEEKITKSYF